MAYSGKVKITVWVPPGKVFPCLRSPKGKCICIKSHLQNEPKPFLSKREGAPTPGFMNRSIQYASWQIHLFTSPKNAHSEAIEGNVPLLKAQSHLGKFVEFHQLKYHFRPKGNLSTLPKKGICAPVSAEGHFSFAL